MSRGLGDVYKRQNLGAPERTVKFSFQRVVGSNKKNVTPLVIFNLMLKMMQEDELWIK